MTSWTGLLSQAWRFDKSRGLSAEMELLDRNLPAALVTYALVAIMATWTYWAIIGDANVLWWGGGATLVAIACFAGRKFLPPPGDLAKVVVYAQAVRFMALLMGVTWGLFALLFMRPEWPVTLTLVIALLAGMSAGGLVLFSASWPVLLAFGLPCLLPLVVVLLPADDPVSQSMGLASLIYLLAMGVFSFHAVQVTRRSISLRFENADLVERLREQTHSAFEARQMAEEANRAKSVFLASASHDLRQPLHALGLFLTALGHTKLDPRQRQMWGHVEASSAAARDMLNALLDFSKVDAGVITPQAQAFPMQSLLHKLERHFAPQANEKGLVFRVRDTDLVVQADPQLVEQVLRNLLANAIRYTERGGVLVGCRRRGAQAVLEVWDTGMGIEPAQHQAIFQEFHQLGNPERDRSKGLGLGLAIVQGLARAMAATVTLVSRPGRGSVFRLGLPLSPLVAREEVLAPLVDAQLAGMRVMLIEDDEAVRVAMAELLMAWGCACEVAGSEAEALKRLDVFTPDVVLADFRLRDHRTGPQAIEAVRTRLARAVPAIIITGDTADDRLRTAVGSGMTLLHKPVGSVPLKQALARAVLSAQPDQADAPNA